MVSELLTLHNMGFSDRYINILIKEHETILDMVLTDTCFWNRPKHNRYGTVESYVRELRKTEERVFEWKKTYALRTLFDEDYPEQLKHMIDSPPVLFISGDMHAWERLTMNACVTVVGSRLFDDSKKYILNRVLHPDPETVFVSGLARGADTAVHAWTRNKTASVAILGYGHEKIPEHQKPLAEHIEKTGLILSEYSPDTIARPQYFPKRNRILAGLSRATVVLASQSKSGSLITARLANELGRDVYAVPWNIDHPFGEGNNALIAQGAIPLCNASQIWDIESNERAIPEKYAHILEFLQSGPKTLDHILSACSCDIADISALEKEKYVEESDTGLWHCI